MYTSSLIYAHFKLSIYAYLKRSTADMGYSMLQICKVNMALCK